MNFPFPVCVHVIPVGEGQHIHAASRLCPCSPRQDTEEPNVWAHSTPDRLTETIEQSGIHDPDVQWIVVAEPIPHHNEHLT